MNAVVENLHKYGVDIEGSYRKNIGSDELYISGLDAFAFDDRVDRMFKAIATSSYDSAERTALDLKETASRLDIIPLFITISLLCNALKEREEDHIKTQLSAFEKSFHDFKAALLII